jgi:hypothetical protein
MEIEFHIVTERQHDDRWKAEVQMRAVVPAMSGRDANGFSYASSQHIVGWHTVIFVNDKESQSAARTEAFNEFFRKVSS